MVRNIDWNKG